MMDSSDDDDVPQLSAHTLAALQEFYAEQEQQESTKSGPDYDQFSLGAVEEDWVREVLCYRSLQDNMCYIWLE